MLLDGAVAFDLFTCEMIVEGADGDGENGSSDDIHDQDHGSL